jgi:hypothetical protein
VAGLSQQSIQDPAPDEFLQPQEKDIFERYEEGAIAKHSHKTEPIQAVESASDNRESRASSSKCCHSLGGGRVKELSDRFVAWAPKARNHSVIQWVVRVRQTSTSGRRIHPVSKTSWSALGRTRTCDLLIRSLEKYVIGCLLEPSNSFISSTSVDTYLPLFTVV